MQVVRVIWNTGRPGGKIWIAGHRWHHGMAGLMAAAPAAVYLAIQHEPMPALAVIALAAGCAAMWHDRPDFPWTSDTDAYTFNPR